jgi:hypothetical protein
VFLSWFTSSGTAIVVIYGTLVFSSFMFIATQNATIIVLRYLVSALICRAVLKSELDGMRRALDPPSPRATVDRLVRSLPLTVFGSNERGHT